MGVVTGIPARTAEIESLNKDHLELLEDLYGFCLDVDDTLSKRMDQHVLGARVVECCAKWRQRAQELAAESVEGGAAGLSDAQQDDLEKKLERALLEDNGNEEGGEDGDDDGEEEEEAEEEEEEEEEDKESQVAPLSPRPTLEELQAMEQRSEALAEERERFSQRRKESAAGSILSRVSTALEMERKKSLEEATSVADSPRVVAESMAFLAEKAAEGNGQGDAKEDDKMAKATADEGAAHRAELEKLAARNEGLVQRLAELSGQKEQDGENKAEHRAEIELLKQEGESLKTRMARLEEERQQAANASGSSAARQELELMRQQQKGKTKKSAKEVLTPEQKLEEHLLHREEIERLRVERSNVTRKLGSDLIAAAAVASQTATSSISPRGEGEGTRGELARKFLSEAEQREREREEALLAKFKDDAELVVPAEVSNLLAALEQTIAAREQESVNFEKRMEEMEKNRGTRSRMREEQLAAQKRREEEKKKEQDEYAMWQAERQRKLDEKKKQRDIKTRAAKGELPKYRLCLVGPKSGKSALAKRFLENGFVEGATESVIDRLHEKPCTIKGTDCVLEVLDTTSMEEFASLRSGWYAGCDGFLAVFDLTRKPSRAFKQLRAFGEEIKKAKGVEDISKVPIVLVANKEDLFEQRKCKAGDALAFAKEWGARYVEASAKTGDNVQAAFETLVALCVQKKDGK
jgi:small GTP-binding protein